MDLIGLGIFDSFLSNRCIKSGTYFLNLTHLIFILSFSEFSLHLVPYVMVSIKPTSLKFLDLNINLSATFFGPGHPGSRYLKHDVVS